MAGEGGKFTMTRDHQTFAKGDGLEFDNDAPFTDRKVLKVLNKWAKRREKANATIRKSLGPDQRKLAKFDALLQKDSSIKPSINQGGDFNDLETARFHATEGEKHRKKAREARAGHGVVSKAHGEALARKHDEMANYHFTQARSVGVV